jgi:flagellar motor switch protein FliM
MVWIAMPVCRSTRCRIFRIAAESSTTKTFDSIPLLTLYSSEPSGLFIRAADEKVAPPPADYRFLAELPIWNQEPRLSRELSQQEIDAVFQNMTDRKRESPAVKFDFRRPDRIPKSQVRAIHLLHDTFVRNLVSSLSAYLRSYLTVNLVSVEQLSYAEFLDGLPSPTCIVSLGLSPYDGNGVLELNPSLVFPILEMLLGGTGKGSATIQRDITEIEQKLLDGLFRIILHDLREAWKGVTAVDFTIESMETEPQLLHLLAPNEAVVSIGVEVRIGESVGMMNIAMPSIVIKMMRQKFDQQWSVRKTHTNAGEQARVLRMLREGTLTLEARLEGPTLSMEALLGLSEGHLLTFDYPVERPVELLVNGTRKFIAQMVSTGRKRACLVEKIRPSLAELQAQGRISDEAGGGSAADSPG